MNKEEWTYTSAFSYSGEHFSIWVKPGFTKTGKPYIRTKAKRTTLEQINNDAKEYGMKYLASTNKEENE